MTSCFVTPTVRLQEQLLRMSLALTLADQFIASLLFDVNNHCHKLLWGMFFVYMLHSGILRTTRNITGLRSSPYDKLNDCDQVYIVSVRV